MELDELFLRAVTLLKERDIPFAVAGGFAASIYRSQYRTTDDIDLITDEKSRSDAVEIIKALNLEPFFAREADLAGGPLFAIKSGRTPVHVIVGRAKGGEKGFGLDFLLSVIPWVPQALKRAQHNTIDFGFGPIPTLTVEDVILAKLAAVHKAERRAKDVDDLESIFEVRPELDLKYLAGQMHSLGLTLPQMLRSKAPEELVKISKDIEKAQRKKARGRAR